MLILKFGHVKMVSCKRGAFNDTLCLCNLFRLEKKKRNNCNLQEQGVFYTCFCDTVYQIDHCLQCCLQRTRTQALCCTNIHTHIYI